MLYKGGHMTSESKIDTDTFNNQEICEERANSRAHGVMTLLSVIAAFFLVSKALNTGNSVKIFASCVYSICLIELFAMSTIYHSRPITNEKEIAVKRTCQKFDHSSVFFLILGTYTPVALSLIGGKLGLGIWIFNIVCTIIGLYLNVHDLKKWHKLSLAMYLVMGWSGLPAFGIMWSKVGVMGFALILIGGLFYSFGVIFYVYSNRRYTHFVWHLFVAIGAFMHYFFVYIYVI